MRSELIHGMEIALKYIEDARRAALPNTSRALDACVEHLKRNIEYRKQKESEK